MTNMECNKNEAARALEIAQTKLAEMDIYGAKTFALKAQTLYPGIDGVRQLLTILEVYISAEQRIDGEVDWYRVLGVEPLADYESIRKHFKKLAFILHPDKNKSEAAEGAFKIVSEAWTFLSDKSKRLAYDQKRYMQRIQHTVLNGNSSLPTDHNGSCGFTDCSNQNAMDRMNARHQKPSHHSRRALSRPESFWTICGYCSLHLEYERKYLNKKLSCLRCCQSFLALETPCPPSKHNISSASSSSYPQQQNSTQHTTNENFYATGSEVVSPTDKRPTFQQVAFFKSGGIGSVPAPASSAAQATDVIQQNYDQLKRKHDDFLTNSVRQEAFCGKTHAASKIDAGLATGTSNAHSGSILKGERPKKKKRLDEQRTYEREMENFMARGNGVSLSSSQNGSLKIERGNAARNCKSSGARQPSRLDTKNLLMVKARMQIIKKLNEWSLAAGSKDSVNLKASDEEIIKKDNGKEEAALDSVTADFCSPIDSDVDPDKKCIDPLSMSVPDPDFHDFDGDRVEKSFADNQVWAVYDDDDGMPRYYAMIHNMLSVKPFKMRISWLNSKTNSELGPLNWIDSGFTKTTGDFRKGKSVTNKSLNSFSHMVKWTKGVKGAIQIYPRKGDIWALYRNWSPDWNACTPGEVIHQYDMMKVLGDYSAEMGVVVAPLNKVAGFKTVFRQQLDPTKTRIIPREELFRFSHQVPSYLLTGQEGPSAPQNFLELDPAAVPLDLLQVLTDIQLEEMVRSAGKCEREDSLGDVEKFMEEQASENNKTISGKATLVDADKEVTAEGMERNGEVMEGEEMIVYKPISEKATLVDADKEVTAQGMKRNAEVMEGEEMIVYKPISGNANLADADKEATAEGMKRNGEVMEGEEMIVYKPISGNATLADADKEATAEGMKRNGEVMEGEEMNKPISGNATLVDADKEATSEGMKRNGDVMEGEEMILYKQISGKATLVDADKEATAEGMKRNGEVMEGEEMNKPISGKATLVDADKEATAEGMKRNGKVMEGEEIVLYKPISGKATIVDADKEVAAEGMERNGEVMEAEIRIVYKRHSWRSVGKPNAANGV